MYSHDAELEYTGPIFDSHTHLVDKESFDLMVKIEEKYGIGKAVLISHSPVAMSYAKEKYPGRFIYAKYFRGTVRFEEGVDYIVRELRTLREEGFDLAKMQSAPVMRGRVNAGKDDLRLDSDEMAPMFETMQEEGLSFILHLSDPDTYYDQRYNGKSPYSTKERDLAELEGVLKRYPKMKFQIAHFAAQPEIHRLDNLSRWLETYSNFNLDTSSARWMVRELGRNPDKARAFFIKYQDRIQFGTDCVAYTDEENYYAGRHSSLRMLLETGVRGVPLPFRDADTEAIGGTFINGLELDDSVLQKIYWDNGAKFHQLD